MIIESFLEFCTDLFTVICNTIVGLVMMFVFCFLPLFGFCYVIMEILNAIK